MSQTDKFCKDCKYYGNRAGFDFCNNPLNGLNPVTGGVTFRDARVNRSMGECGTGGKWFESSKIVFSTDTLNKLSRNMNNPKQKPKNLFTRFIEYLYNKFCR